MQIAGKGGLIKKPAPVFTLEAAPAVMAAYSLNQIFSKNLEKTIQVNSKSCVPEKIFNVKLF